MAETSVEPRNADLGDVVDQTFAAIMCVWPWSAADAQRDAMVARRAELLAATGADVVLVGGDADHEPAVDATSAGLGRLLLVPGDGSAVLEAGESAARTVWQRPRSPDPDPDECRTAAAVAWLVGDLWDRGVAPGLVLALGAVTHLAPVVPAGVVTVPADASQVCRQLDHQLARRAARRVPRATITDGWCVILDGDPPERRRVDETLLTVADGRVGTRGSVEEGGPHTDPLVVAGGVYDARDPLVTLLPGPDWARLALHGARGGTQRRVLDLRTGVMTREGAVAGGWLRTLRFAAAARPGAGVLRAEGPPGSLGADVPLRAPTDDAGYTAGAREGLVWAGTRSVCRGGITAAAAQTEGSDQGMEVIERLAALSTGAYAVPSVDKAAAELTALQARGFDRLLTEQRATWARRWADADVVVDGDPDVQVGTRFALFHLLASVPADGEAALGARGLSGRAYAGHVFWDADVYALPALAATRPSAARAMVEYRLRRLPAARRAALARGCEGARFPWESAHDGREATPPTVHHASGVAMPVLTRDHADHIVADVAWGAWQYAQWTGDWGLLEGRGAPLLVDTARYWASRIRVDAEGIGHIDEVIGPDEYHGPVDDNAFTNVMARWNLRRAADLVDRSRHLRGRYDVARWRALADGLDDGLDPATGVYEQFEGFFELEPLLIEEFATVPVAADLLLGVELTAATQIVKQADVLMLHHLVPDETAASSLEANLEVYGPRTAHGSSLSPAVHASLLARAGRPDEALELLRLACRLDLDDLTGTTAGGLHIATFGGVWQALVHGFAGLRPRGSVLECDPVLPSAWDRLVVHVRVRGARVVVEIDHDGVVVEPEPGSSLVVWCGGTAHEVDRRRRLAVPGART